MKIERFIQLISAWSCISCAMASQDQLVQWSGVQLDGRYQIVPDSVYLRQCDISQSCDAPTFSGVLHVRVTTSPESGELTQFEVRLDDRIIPVDLGSILDGRAKFYLGQIRAAFPDTYIPLELRDRYIGSTAIIYIYGMYVEDPTCDSGVSSVLVEYLFETDDIQLSSECDMD